MKTVHSIVGVCFLAFPLMIASCYPQSPRHAAESSLPAASAEVQAALNRISESICARTGLIRDAVKVSWSGAQFTVTIVNSPLNPGDHRARNIQATDIVNTMESAISGMPEFAGALAIHVNFIARPMAGGAEGIVDKIDFRKGSGGRFVLHTT
jgi:hypothetical protein